MADKKNPVRDADDEARTLAHALMSGAKMAALGVISPDTGAPFVSRIAFALGPDGTPMSLISELSQHNRALCADPRASLLIGEPGPKGDPLTHPRLTLQAIADILAPDQTQREALRGNWLHHHPKAKLYIDFADFHFVRFTIEGGLLNGGFGKAYALAPNDLKVI